MRKRIFISILFISKLCSSFAQPAEKILLNTDKQWYYPGENLWFAVNTFNACGDSLAQISSVVYVELIGTDGKPVIQSKIAIENALGNGSVTIGDNITSGTYNIVAYTSWMKNFGAGVFARKPIYVVNPARPGVMNTKYSLPDQGVQQNGNLRIETLKKQYGRREPVIVKFSTDNSARVSATVYRIDELEKGAEKIYMSQLSDPCSATHQQPAPFIYERRGHVILGRVTDRRTQLPAVGIRGYASPVDYPGQFFVATSDAAGIIRFEVGDLAGKTELVLNTDAANQNNYTIELISPYADNTTSLPEKGSDSVFESNAPVIDEAMMSAQVQRIFTGNDSVSRSGNGVDSVPFYAKPDAFYLMSDYVRFASVEEIMREYIFSIGIQTRGGRLYPVVIDALTKKPFAEAPLVLVNGAPVYDAEKLFNMNSDDFYSIGVVARKYFMGHQVFYGIIDVRLKTPLKEFGANARVMDYDGPEVNEMFISPDYSSDLKRNSRKPDFRNVLYWNPDVKNANGNGSIEFYTSDLEGEYVIVVQAVTKDGRVHLGKSTIEVK